MQIPGIEPSVNEPIKMEVGIEDCLHIEFEYEKRCYHLQDVICGKINFLLVRIKIKHMELAVIRRETSGEGVALSAALTTPGGGGGGGAVGTTGAKSDMQNIVTETQTLLKYEIMDGKYIIILFMSRLYIYYFGMLTQLMHTFIYIHRCTRERRVDTRAIILEGNTRGCHADVPCGE